MTYQATVINVMIATPSDVAKERQIVRDVLHEWNVVHSSDRRSVLMPLGWETHSAPALGGRPQAIINEQVLRLADLLVAVFWTRLGSPTGRAASGTVEEIQEHLDAGKQVMLYFSSAPVRPDSVDDVQYRALKNFRAEMGGRGLVESYESMTEFHEKFSRQLALTVIRHWSPAAESDKSHSDGPISPPLGARIAGLSADAKTLLSETAADHGGMLLVLQSFAGLQISVNSKQLVEDRDRRSEARWRSAIDELVRSGYLEDRVGKGEVFSLTHAGFTAAELLRE